MRIHPPLAALIAAAACFGLAVTASTVTAQVPNRLYGTVTLNGSAAPVGTVIVAQTAGKACGQTTVTATAVSGTTYPYVLDVPGGGAAAECKPGAVLTFTVGGQTAAQTFTLDDIASFQRLDLTAPGIPNVPVTTRTVELAAGCTDVTSSFPDGTTAAAVAAAVSPAGALSAIWRYDAAAGAYRGFAPGSFASDLATVSRGDTLRICTSAAATLSAPA